MFEARSELAANELMTEDVVGLAEAASATDARDWFDDRGFDVAPVISDGDRIDGGPGVAGGDPIGYVEPTDVDGEDSQATVEEVSHDVTMDCLVDPRAPFEDVLDALFDRSWYFVDSRSGLGGVLTRADLNKPPVSAYFYALVYEFETRLRDLVRDLGVGWEAILEEDTHVPIGYPHETFLREVDHYYERSVAQDLELAKIHYVTLTHLREIVRHSPSLQEVLPIGADQIHAIKELRNDVAHPNPMNIVTVTADPSPVSDTPEGHRGMADIWDVHYDLSRTLEQLRNGV